LTAASRHICCRVNDLPDDGTGSEKAIAADGASSDKSAKQLPPTTVFRTGGDKAARNVSGN
jgi:hypothetical protein